MNNITRKLAATCLLTMAACALPTSAHAAGQVKALLCTGDYGMYAQDRVKTIEAGVEGASPGHVAWTALQSYNFVKKLETPGYPEQFDVIVFGDVALGELTTSDQQALVDFVNQGGGLVFALKSKSYIPYNDQDVIPMPLAPILPYKWPDSDAQKARRADTVAFGLDAPLFKGLDFSTAPIQPTDKIPHPILALERPQGKGHVLALYGAFGADWDYVSYATFKLHPNGWELWPGFGTLWTRILDNVAQSSPILAESRADADAAIKNVPLSVTAAVDATKQIDDIRAADFSIVNITQLYVEDGGTNEDKFLALNPTDFMDRTSQRALDSTAGKLYPDKTVLFKKYHISGIYMANNSYGSYWNWPDSTYTSEIASAVAAIKKWPEELVYFQPGNEPPINPDYDKFHNRICAGVIAGTPNVKTMGPNTAFSLEGVDPTAMKAFIADCGANTDVLNWHIYGAPPETVLTEANYWSKQATGKLRSPGPAQVMFTEADAWNSEESQFNYLMDRAYTFLPSKTIIGCFQYCMDPRYEGGSYMFGVLQPTGEFTANYNGYWAWRNLRGKMVDTTLTGAAPGALGHCHVLSSSSADGKTVTVIAYYDAGYFDGVAHAKSDKSEWKVNVKLPPGDYSLERSDVTWNTNVATTVPGTVSKTASVNISLAPFQAVAWTWTRQ